MASVFSKIRTGEIKAQDVIYEDEKVFIILSQKPHTSGHSLIIPVEEAARFEDLSPEMFAHMSLVSQKYAKALELVYSPERVGIAIDGFEVDHVHMHIMPIWREKGGVWKKEDHTRIASFDELKKESDIIKQALPAYFGN